MYVIKYIANKGIVVTDGIFCDNFILHCHIIWFTGMNIIVVLSPYMRCEFLSELPPELVKEKR